MILKGKQRVQILIADQQSAVRSALRLLLEERLELDVVGEAADNQQLLTKLDRIERTLGNINGRLKKLEEHVAIQDKRIAKIRLETDSNEPNKVPSGGPAIEIF